MRVAGPQTGRSGLVRTEEGKKSLVVRYIRKMESITSVKAECFSLLVRLESLGGTGDAAARWRRGHAPKLDKGCQKGTLLE